MKYPKLSLLLLTFFLAYLLFSANVFLQLRDSIISLGYLGSFILGIFYSYGFTAAPATALLLILGKTQNIYLGGTLAGFGALLGDLVLFKFFRYSFAQELKLLTREKIIIQLTSTTPHHIKKFLVPIVASFVIMSPLPDEIGVFLFATYGSVTPGRFSLISFLLNTFGILLILGAETLI